MIPIDTLEKFRGVLDAVKEMFPGSHPVIGGGALRDAFHGRPIKDVDVFLRNVDHSDLAHPYTKALVPPGVAEYACRSDMHGVWDITAPIHGFSVQLILADFTNLTDLAGTFDLGFSRITFDGQDIYYHPDFVKDSAKQQIVIRRKDDNGTISRSLRRVARISQKYIGWEVPDVPKCPCCKGIITPFRNTISLKEYGISGLCQSCQDSVFGLD